MGVRESEPAAGGGPHGTPGFRTFTLHSDDAHEQVVVMTNLGEDSLSPQQTDKPTA